MISACVHTCSGEHSHIADIQIAAGNVIFLNYSRSRSLCKRAVKSLVLIEKRHHFFHGFDCARKLLRLPGSSQILLNLACRNGEHHMVHQNICLVQNTVSLIIIFRMLFIMQVLKLCRVSIQLVYISLDACKTLFSLNAVYVQHRNLREPPLTRTA